MTSWKQSNLSTHNLASVIEYSIQYSSYCSFKVKEDSWNLRVQWKDTQIEWTANINRFFEVI